MFQNISLMKFSKQLRLFLFFLLCLLFIFVFFIMNKFFLIKKIQIISEKKFLLVNKDELMDKNLIFINRDKIAKKIILENPLLKKIIVKKIWPATLELTVYFYDSMASLIVNKGVFNLSNDGRILSKKSEGQPSLAVINYYQKLNSSSFQTGDWIDYKDIKQTLFFIDKLKQINLSPLTIDIKGQDMLVFNLKDNKKIIFSNKKERELQYYQLELIIRQFKIEGKEFIKIDLRFEKPIITF